jgi:hypothetical protein
LTDHLTVVRHGQQHAPAPPALRKVATVTVPSLARAEQRGARPSGGAR